MRYFLLLLLVLPQVLSGATSRPMYTPDSIYLFGVVNDQGQHYEDLWQRGLRAVTFELQWKLYEPQEGLYDQTYIDHMKGLLRSLNERGWFVQLVPGIHYAPMWVFTNYPDSYYVNQFGDKYDPDPLTQGDFRVINAPFNPQARTLISGYLAKIFQDFDQSDQLLQFDSIRVGAGPQGELRYPPAQWNGKSNSYWAFDAFAQSSAASGIPQQAVGWRPGIDDNPGSINRGQLLINPGFEEKYQYFPLPGWSPDDEVIAEQSSEMAQSGNQSLKITLFSNNRIHQYVRVTPGQNYEIGGWAASQNGDGIARIIVTQYNASQQLIDGAPFVKLETNQNTYTQLSTEITIRPDTSFLKFEMDGDRPGIYYFDNVWLRRSGEANQPDRDIIVPMEFYNWYVDSMTNYQNWQISEIRKYYNGQLDLVYAGKGVRLNQITDALNNDLKGDGWSESSAGLYGGADYLRHVSGLTDNHIALYMTGIEDPPEDKIDDTSPFAGQWSGARWLSELAHTHNFTIWGENSGGNTRAEMDVAIKRMRQNGFIGLMWAHESQLYTNPNPNNYASADDYQKIVEFFMHENRIYLPLVDIDR